MMKGKIFKLKKNKLETWKAWCFTLSTNRKEEALETLKEEGLLREYGGVFNIKGEWYGYIFADKEGKSSNMEKKINQTHKKTVLECMDEDKENRSLIETLYSLEVG